MKDENKAKMYDELIRESERLQKINSKYKSEYIFNIPQHIQKEIDGNNIKLNELVKRLENLFV